MLSNCFCFVLVTSSQLDSYQLSLVYLLPRDVNKPQNGLFQKKLKQVGRRGTGLRIFFCENSPGIFLFSFTLPLEIPDKAKLNPFIFHKIVLDPLEISRPKTKIHGNSTLLFLGHPSKFHFVFNSTCYFFDTAGNSISSKPPCLDFFWKSPVASYLTTGSFLLFINNYCRPDIIFHRQVGRVIGQINIQRSHFQLAVSVSPHCHQVIQVM